MQKVKEELKELDKVIWAVKDEPIDIEDMHERIDRVVDVIVPTAPPRFARNTITSDGVQQRGKKQAVEAVEGSKQAPVVLEDYENKVLTFRKKVGRKGQ